VVVAGYDYSIMARYGMGVPGGHLLRDWFSTVSVGVHIVKREADSISWGGRRGWIG
jgi:hypothetical protein